MAKVEPHCTQAGNMDGERWEGMFESTKRVYDTGGISPALNTCGGGQREVKIAIKNATKQGYLLAKDGDGVDLNYPNQNKRRGRVQDGMAQTLETQPGGVGVVEKTNIRKLTPREYWRLMGFSDDDFDKAKEVVSETQLYKQAGNSIVVPVLEAIFKQMIERTSNDGRTIQESDSRQAERNREE